MPIGNVLDAFARICTLAENPLHQNQGMGRAY